MFYKSLVSCVVILLSGSVKGEKFIQYKDSQSDNKYWTVVKVADNEQLIVHTKDITIILSVIDASSVDKNKLSRNESAKIKLLVTNKKGVINKELDQKVEFVREEIGGIWKLKNGTLTFKVEEFPFKWSYNKKKSLHLYLPPNIKYVVLSGNGTTQP